MSGINVTERFIQLHAKLHSEGQVITALLNAGVSQHRVLALYPFELTGWLNTLLRTVSPGGWDTVRATLTAAQITNGWLDSVQQLNSSLARTLYGDHELFYDTPEAEAMREELERPLTSALGGETIVRNVSFILFETTYVAGRWHQLPQLHGWADTEGIILKVLGVLAQVHAEGLMILAELATAREKEAQ